MLLMLYLSALVGVVDNWEHLPISFEKRTENEWMCPRCRNPAEGHYCIRCGEAYKRPKK